MSAFVGVVHLDGESPYRYYLDDMAQYLSRLGPDSQSILVDAGVGMVHALLRVPGSCANHEQPLDTGRYLVVGDARLDRRKALMRELGRGDEEDASDTKLILLAWLAWGDATLNHLRGDFAVAIWDKLERKLCCIRDQLGVKQFFFMRRGNVIVFSNVLNCLRRYPGFRNTLNDQAVVDFLVFGFNLDFTSSTFADIQRLAPAHGMEVSRDSTQIKRIWSLPVDGELRYRRLEDYVQHFNALLEQAVNERLVGGPVAVSMSGGLDSTAVAAFAKEVLPAGGRLSLFTLDIASLWPEDREAEYAAQVASSLGAQHYIHAITSKDLFERENSSEWLLPEPSRDAFWPAYMAVFRQIAQGHRFGLTGHGADSLLIPPGDHFATLLRNRQWGRLLGESLSFYRVHGRRPPLRLRTALKEKYERAPFRPKLPAWLRPEMVERTGIEDRFMARLEGHGTVGCRIHPYRQEAYRDIASPIWPATLLRFDPQTTGLPLEFRHPYLDLSLVEGVVAMPPSPWFYNKALLRQAAKGLLPDSVRSRRKAMPKISPVYRGLVAGERLEGMGGPLGSDAITAYVDCKELGKLVENSGRIKPEETDQLTLPMAFVNWLQLNGI